jgi:hypothetical protein
VGELVERRVASAAVVNLGAFSASTKALISGTFLSRAPFLWQQQEDQAHGLLQQDG